MRNDPYADAPRLPLEGDLDPRQVVQAGHDPVELEIGPGRGGFLVERLLGDDQVRIVGLEIRRKWATKVDRRLSALGLAGRGRVFAEDARVVIPRMVDDCLSVVYVNFPDPWWKKRHQKRLVVSGPMLDQLARLLTTGGELFLQTDVAERADAYERLLGVHPAFESWGDAPRVAENPRSALSPRERRAMADGLPIFRMRWRRVAFARNSL
jgi:tRNA (guanine-N7-)-methyltransferase